MISFRPTPDEVGERVDIVLSRRAGIPRSLAQRALRDGSLVVNGAAVRPSHRLDANDVVEGEAPVREVHAPEAEDIPIEVRYSDARVLVVSKPAGVVTHPAGGHRGGTLVNALLALGVPLAAADSDRPGIVHRLDKDTSGLLLVAKDDAAREFLQDAMKARRIERRYLALIRGRLGATTGTIEAPIGRHAVRKRLMAVVAEGRPAVTHYEEVAVGPDLSLIEARLETGRTHQIRVHLAHVGHPIVGDRTYGGGGDVAQRLGLDRFFLHAWKLAFPHPEGGRTIAVEDPLPTDLTAALATAGLPPPR